METSRGFARTWHQAEKMSGVTLLHIPQWALCLLRSDPRVMPLAGGSRANRSGEKSEGAAWRLPGEAWPVWVRSHVPGRLNLGTLEKPPLFRDQLCPTCGAGAATCLVFRSSESVLSLAIPVPATAAIEESVGLGTLRGPLSHFFFPLSTSQVRGRKNSLKPQGPRGCSVGGIRASVLPRLACSPRRCGDSCPHPGGWRQISERRVARERARALTSGRWRLRSQPCRHPALG